MLIWKAAVSITFNCQHLLIYYLLIFFEPVGTVYLYQFFIDFSRGRSITNTEASEQHSLTVKALGTRDNSLNLLLFERLYGCRLLPVDLSALLHVRWVFFLPPHWVFFFFFLWLTAPCETQGRGMTAAVVCLVFVLLVCGGVLAFLLWRYSNAQRHYVRHKSHFRLMIKPAAWKKKKTHWL